MRYIGRTISAILVAMAFLVQVANAAPDILGKQEMIDGYSVTFQVMAAEKGREMGGSHNVMIKVEKGDKALTMLLSIPRSFIPTARRRPR